MHVMNWVLGRLHNGAVAPCDPLAGAIAPSSPTEKRAMDLLMLTTPIVVMIGLLALMQRIETGMTEKAPVRISTGEAPSRVKARARHEEPSPFLSTAPLALLVITAVLTASAVVRMAS